MSLDLPLGYLSVSQIRTYLRCPKQYEYQYIQGIRSVGNSGVLVGRAFHSAIEKANKAKLEEGEILSVDDVKDAYNDAFEKQKEDVEWEEGEDQGKAKDEGLKMTSHYYEQIGQAILPTLVEHPFEIDIDGVKLKGWIDLAERDGSIRDFKTSKRTPGQDVVETSIQLTAYAMAYREMTGQMETKVGLDYVVPLKNGPKITRLETQLDDGRIERFRNLVNGVAKSISAGIFYPVEEGTACSFCSFKDICKGKGA